jgi:hypothetical protein
MARRVGPAARTLAVSCVTAAAGVLSAQALGEVGLPPITVSLPTVSLPIPTTPPAPLPVPRPPPSLPPPPVPVPAPPAVAPTPAVGPPPAIVPTPPARSAPASASSAGQPATPLITGSPSSSGTYSSTVQPQSAGRGRPGRVTRLRVTYRRVPSDGKNRLAIRITFTLSAPARVHLVVRGPAPSCAVIARFAVRGRSGTNHLRFTDRIGRRHLAPGTYRIVARTRSGPAARSIVVVGSGPVERSACPRPERSSPFEQLGAAFDDGAPAPPSKHPTTTSGGVLPAIGKKLRELPRALPRPPISGFSASTRLPAWLLGLGVALVALAGATLIRNLVRYLRRRYAYY